MDPVEQVTLIAGEGLEDNADLRRKRQVTILEQEEWDRVTVEAGVEADPANRRANLLVSGFPLANSRRQVLVIGACQILIHGETKPCYQMDRVADGLRKIMWADWAGGAYGEVLVGGQIQVGDPISWVPAPETVETLSPSPS